MKEIKSLNRFRLKHSGFTLIELMIVVAIVAILVGLALPNYQQSIRKSRRADAQTDLLEFANTAERIFTATNSYATVVLPTSNDHYTYTFPSVVTATTWVLLVTPKVGSAQTADTCGWMQLTQSGQRTKGGSLAGCW